jgi:hypothetical protein
LHEKFASEASAPISFTAAVSLRGGRFFSLGQVRRPNEAGGRWL